MTEPPPSALSPLPSLSVPEGAASNLPVPAAKPAHWTRRRGGGSQKRPSELLVEIGISGRDVVRILTERGWEVREPKALEENKRYYAPGGRAKGSKAEHLKDLFIGEGELYAHVLELGGRRYLIPDADTSSTPSSPVSSSVPPSPSIDSLLNADDVTQHASDELPTEVSVYLLASLSCDEDGSPMPDESSASTSETMPPFPQQRKWKRRKKLSTARGKSAERGLQAKPGTPKTVKKGVTPPYRRKPPAVKRGSDPKNHTTTHKHAIAESEASDGGGNQLELGGHHVSLATRGWRAQLLRDVEVHLLRFMAEVDRHRRASESSSGKRKAASRPSKDVGPHEFDTAKTLTELKELTRSVQDSQEDLRCLVTRIVVHAELRHIPDRMDSAGQVEISRFQSTGHGELDLMRDIERYLLLLVAAVRRYQRTKDSAYVAEEFASSGKKGASPRLASGAPERTDLRTLLRSIERSQEEMRYMMRTLVAQVEKQQSPGEGPRESVCAVGMRR
ncbi:hypothetical protein BBJ28_00020045 [Nothophytophthora sp. Chile5]|nr:hypothetical protein BBJ28_00020045 [Nothophytophthora sp. Chile5]